MQQISENDPVGIPVLARPAGNSASGSGQKNVRHFDRCMKSSNRRGAQTNENGSKKKRVPHERII